MMMKSHMDFMMVALLTWRLTDCENCDYVNKNASKIKRHNRGQFDFHEVNLYHHKLALHSDSRAGMHFKATLESDTTATFMIEEKCLSSC